MEQDKKGKKDFDISQFYIILENAKHKKILNINNEQFLVPAEYISNPCISKEIWSKLGDVVSAKEKNMINASGDKLITLRLDGNSFSGVVPALRKRNIFSAGYSLEFENAMIETTKALIDKLDGCVIYAFTQSDEITLILKPASISNGVQQPHIYNGRHDKIITISAGKASIAFSKEIFKIILQKNNDTTQALKILSELPDICFDCRMGVFDTIEEAFSLILWRAYDCGVNGLSSGVLMSGVQGAKKINEKCGDEKIKWLQEQNLLPLKPHQAYGTFFCRYKKETEITNSQTGEKTTKMKWTTDIIPGPVIVNFKNGVFSL